jgi:hypothetical protein
MPAFFVGINDPLGGNPQGTPFTPVIFNLFDAWANQQSHDKHTDGEDDDQQSRCARIVR